MSTEREESFGGVVVHDGNVLVITPAGRPQIATLPEGRAAGGRAARGDRPARGAGGDGRRGADRRAARRRPLPLPAAAACGSFKTVGFYLCEYVSGDTADHDHEVDDARWMPIEQARTELTYPGEREMIERALSKHSGAM